MSSDDEKAKRSKEKFQIPSPVAKSKLQRTEAERLVDKALEAVGEMREEIEDGTESLEAARTATNNALNSLKSDVETTLDVFDRTYGEFSRIAWVLPGVVAAVYFAIVALTGKIALDSVTLGGLGLLVTLMIVLRLVTWVLWNQIQPEPDPFSTNLSASARNLVGHGRYGVIDQCLSIVELFGVCFDEFQDPLKPNALLLKGDYRHPQRLGYRQLLVGEQRTPTTSVSS